jgi:hypothetical protein
MKTTDLFVQSFPATMPLHSGKERQKKASLPFEQ